MSQFILMLTRDDLTVTDALALYGEVRHLGLRHVGCKDIGLPADELTELLAAVRRDEHKTHLEVVSETPEATLRSARAAARMRPDYLIGGTLIEPIRQIIDGTQIRFFPYVGRIVGHPCLLRGTIAEICDDVRRAEAAGADVINLLAYRYDGDVPALVQAVVAATQLPVICAGSIASTEQIRLLAKLGVWAFTVGTAVLDREFVLGGTVAEQIEAVLAAAA